MPQKATERVKLIQDLVLCYSCYLWVTILEEYCISQYFVFKNSCSDILGYGHIQTDSKHEKCYNIFIDVSGYESHKVTYLCRHL